MVWADNISGEGMFPHDTKVVANPATTEMARAKESFMVNSTNMQLTVTIETVDSPSDVSFCNNIVTQTVRNVFSEIRVHTAEESKQDSWFTGQMIAFLEFFCVWYDLTIDSADSAARLFA
jgi:hypothetical protein